MEKLKSGLEFIFSSYKRTAAIFFIGALTLAIPITITLVGQQQDIRQRAAGSNTSPCPPLGDVNKVNGDGVVNALDELILKQYDGGLLPDGPLKTWVSQHGDVNHDGTVNATDALFVAQYEGGLISTFPACSTRTPTPTTPPKVTGTICDSAACGKYGAICCPGSSSCIAWWQDNSNCGACGNKCSAGATCQLNVPGNYTQGASCKSTGGQTTPTPTRAPTPTSTPSIDTIPPTSAITSPSAGSTQTGNFYVSVTDSDTGGSGLAKCEYAVTDYNNGFTVERTIRTCNSQILITVGPNGNCRTEGTNKCTVRVDSTDNAGNLASLSGRSFSISYTGTGGPPTATPRPPTPTPVIIVDPFPTTTPTPTGIPPGTSNLSVTITLTGIGVSQILDLGINNNPKRPQRDVRVTIVNSGNQQVDLTNSTVNYDPATGKYKGNVGLGSRFVSGSYLVKVRLDNTLWKTIPGIQNITSGQIHNAPGASLVAGDIIQDNEINLLDYNALLSCYGNKACATKIQADVNDDDKVDELDINILYAGFAKRVGD